MRIKHTYLFTMLVGLVWVGMLFGHDKGPSAGGAGVVNGLFPGATGTCDQAQCHNSFTLNSGPGTLQLSGLPAQWTAGATYPLTITVPKTANSVVYGFQISAVFASSNPPQSAGTLSKVAVGSLSGGKPTSTDNTRISVLTDSLNGTGIQVVEHNLNNQFSAPTQTFYVNWTAPTSTSGGSVKFNLAGNAANGDVDPGGDYIYTLANVVAPSASAPPDFAFSASIPSATITAGTGTSVGVTVTPANGFNSSVSLSVTGLPSGVTGTFAPSTISGSGTATLTINMTACAVPPNSYPLTITATSGALTHSASFSLTIGGNTFNNFSVANFASSSTSTSGTGSVVCVGYSTIQPNSGSTTPAGVEIFGFRPNGILLSETGVPASPLITSGRIYAETTGAIGTPGTVDTGLAIANPGNTAGTLSLFFTDATGTSTAVRQTPIAAASQTVAFLSQSPFHDPSLGSTFQGTFNFTSTVPISVIALRGFSNERGDFLMSTLPVIDTTAPALAGTQVVPHFATGNGWTTQIILINPGSAALTGSIQFLAGIGQSVSAGSPATVMVGGQLVTSALYAIAAGSSQKIVASGPVAGGSIHIVPTAGGSAPVPLVVFSFKPATITVTEAGAPANSGSAFRMYVESSGTSGQSGNIQSGIAVANTTNGTANVTFELFNLDGTSTGLAPASVSLTANSQKAAFLAEFFPNLPQPFKGVLRISSGATISVVGLRGRYNERNPPDFLITTTPPTLESSPASSNEFVFPQLANGGGYTTQFILFSGTAGQISAGTLRFFDPNGNPLPLPFN